MTSEATKPRRQRTTKRRFIITWASVVAIVLAIAVTLDILMLGAFRTVLDGYFRPPVERSDNLTASSAELTEQIEAEGLVMLKNDGTLPLDANPRVNVFGWSSTSPVFGGTGSGAVDTERAVGLLDGLRDAGIDYNTDLEDFYRDFRTERPQIEIRAQDWTAPEPTLDEYDEAGIFDSATEYSDTAIFVVSRSGGEGADLSTSLGTSAGDIGEQELPDGRVVNVGSAGSEYEDDLDASKHYLELSNREIATLERVTSDFENVIVLLNTGNVFETSFVDEMDVDSLVWVGGPGETGFAAVGDMLVGEVNPSGRTVDTWARDLLSHPSTPNFGRFTYTDSEDVDTGDVDISYSGDPATSPGFQYVNYGEGIYVGYRYYETAFAGDEGGYGDAVQYPLGHGLSYTSFSQDMGELRETGDTLSVDVEVTNTGDVAGKDVVQLYQTAPYTEGGIEKSFVDLVALGKTETLEPGASQTVTLSFSVEDLASFDQITAGAWVVEEGTYEIKLMSNAHDLIDSRDYTVDETIVYDESNPRSTDQVAATTQFADAGGELPKLSRADDFANANEALAQATSREMTDAQREAVRVEIPDTDSGDMPTTGADNGLELADLVGADYDDPQWDELLDQMTVDEMTNLIAFGGYGTQAVSSVGKPATIDVDGPQGLSSFLGNSVRAGAYPTAMVLASTWNETLAYERGQMVGYEALELGVNSWYAPGMNLHRSPFGGRNFEYYSEDSLLSGVIAAQEVRGAQELGLNAYIKHFALNEQETFRNSRLITWADEQTIREIYLPPFEDAVEVGGATSVMSAYNYIGGVWAGAMPELLENVLTDEWGFRGTILTDYFGDYGYMNADWALSAGGDLMLSTLGSFGATPTGGDTAEGLTQMRQAAKDILFTTANSNVMFTEDERAALLEPIGGEVWQLTGFNAFADSVGQQPWTLLLYAGNVVVLLLLGLLVFFKARKYRVLFPRDGAERSA